MTPLIPAYLDLIVFAEDRLADLSNGEADVALRYGEGPYPGQTARRRRVGRSR